MIRLVEIQTICAALLLACGCLGPVGQHSSPGNSTLSSIRISPPSATVPLGGTQQFTATGIYANGSQQDISSSVMWSVSTGSIGSISSGGLLSTVAQGTTTVTATLGAVIGSAAVKVAGSGLVGISVSPATASIAMNTAQQFSVIGSYSDGSMKPVSQASWSTTQTGVATVNSGGLALAKGTGTTTITATAGTLSASAMLMVTGATPVSLALSPSNTSIPFGTAQQFTATGSFSDGTTQNITPVAMWSSSPPTVATVTSTGRALANGIGTGTVTAQFGSALNSAVLTVVAPSVVSISIVPGNFTMALGTNQTFAAIATFNDGSIKNVNGTATWSISPPSLASISSGGLLTALTAGTGTISVTNGSVQASTALTVTTATLQSITVSPSSPTIPVGTNLKFESTGNFSDGSSQIIGSFSTWMSSNLAAATMNGDVATGVQNGTTTITANASINGHAASGATVATIGPAALTSIAIFPANPTCFSNLMAPEITVGMPLQYVDEGYFSDGTQQELTVATWTTSNPAVASVTPIGTVSALSVGTSTISASFGAIAPGTSNLTVTTEIPTFVISPAVASIAVGAMQQFGATATYSDGKIECLTSALYWTSSNPAVATISNGFSNTATVTAVGPGSTIISAILLPNSTVVGSADLTVF